MTITEQGLFEVEQLSMPREFFGNMKTPGGYTKTDPREWTSQEIDWVLEKKQEGYSNDIIAKAIERSPIALQIKLKRLSKVEDNYNSKNREVKYSANRKFFDSLQPTSVLDLFAGNSWYQDKALGLITNDKDERFDTNYHQDALKLLCKFYGEGKKFDLIDLDPYGSAYECFDLAIKMSRKGIVVSFGEWGHKRWKRTDYVAPRYGINTLEQFGEGELFIKEFQRIAACNKKQATPKQSVLYGNFLRVYFELQDIKVTSQWEDKN